MTRHVTQTRKIGPFEVSAVGLGCMSLSHAYGTPPDAAHATALLNEALDLGYTFLDTAALYGFGANESLLSHAVMHRRAQFVLASKCGIGRNADGKREIDGRPAALKKGCDESLKRLKTDCIDLYYLHRWDRKVPIEDSIGALADLVKAGKVRAIGLSEVSAGTLRKAHAVHRIAAVQSEYSLWTRNPEYGVLEACAELGAGFVAFSPVGRGFLTGKLYDPSAFAPGDIRRNMPRFQSPNFEANLALLETLASAARTQGCTMAQLALAWVMSRGPHVVPIPGTTKLEHLRENAGAGAVVLDPEMLALLDRAFASDRVHGGRYNAATQKEIDTEEAA